MGLVTPLRVIKKKLLQSGLFPGSVEGFYYCASQSNGCVSLKAGIQRLMDIRTILSVDNQCESLSHGLKIEYVYVISKTLVKFLPRVPSKLLLNLVLLL